VYTAVGELVKPMRVTPGRLEITTAHLYFYPEAAAPAAAGPAAALRKKPAAPAPAQ
jgi:hypothetical protein